MNCMQYRKRSWMIALVLHLAALVVVLTGYFTYLYHTKTSADIGIQPQKVITANLLSFQQSQSVLSKNTPVPKSKQKTHLTKTDSGQYASQADNKKVVKNQQMKLDNEQDEKQNDNNHQQSNQIVNQKKYTSSQQVVQEYLTDLSKYLYQQISQKISNPGKVQGKLYITIMPDGRLESIRVKLNNQNLLLQKELYEILSQYPIQKKLLIKISKPFFVVIPFKFH